jgi:undecaprenyl-diphosphatase
LAWSFLPAAAAGLVLHRAIKAWLFAPLPVVAALAAGGVLMVAGDPWLKRRTQPARTLASLQPREALLIGLAQCLALWPGTSRAMVTLAAGMALGLPGPVAAEYSFLLALPTLGAAAVFDAARGGPALLAEAGALSLAAGFLTAAATAAVAVRGLVRYLGRHGLALFGWYRLGLTVLLWLALRAGMVSL